ncbi:hypothetical protein H8356DRAFT_1331484 [Neocallimastix lanati (nom. inval.)]|nr:hypothetical protein H8356DRAFT_1331484 [Neocallimastix sp. JGI-2020a]
MSFKYIIKSLQIKEGKKEEEEEMVVREEPLSRRRRTGMAVNHTPLLLYGEDQRLQESNKNDSLWIDPRQYQIFTIFPSRCCVGMFSISLTLIRIPLRKP